MFRTLNGHAPKIALPKGAVDCHIHIFDGSNYSAQPGGPPAPVDALTSDYKQVQKWLGIDRVVITQGNAYQTDNRCTIDAVQQFGNNARGIVSVHSDISDAELESMHKMGICGARIMNLNMGPVGLDEMLEVNARIHPFDWSMIVQFDGCQILRHVPRFEQIKGDYVIDHIGKFLKPVDVDSPQFNALLKLMDRGNCYLKLAACYETSLEGYPDYSDVGVLAEALVRHAPERIIWGSNFPHNMAKTAAAYPDDAHLLDLTNEWLGSDKNRHLAFVENPNRLYGFTS